MFRYLKHPEQMFVASGIFMDEMQSYGYRVDSLFGKLGFYLACVLRRVRKLIRWGLFHSFPMEILLTTLLCDGTDVTV